MVAVLVVEHSDQVLEGSLSAQLVVARLLFRAKYRPR